MVFEGDNCCAHFFGVEGSSDFLHLAVHFVQVVYQSILVEVDKLIGVDYPFIIAAGVKADALGSSTRSMASSKLNLGCLICSVSPRVDELVIRDFGRVSFEDGALLLVPGLTEYLL